MGDLGKWAVVDEESMSTEPNAAILAIGATMIDNLTPVDRFYVNVDLQSCRDAGLHESESTRKWWSEQSAEAFNATQTDTVPLRTALQMWSDWINKHGGKKVRLMGNGPCADNMWLNSAYKACGMKNPVPFFNDICHRTLNWIGGAWFDLDKGDVPFKGVKHHAGDDAEHEAQHAIMVLNKLRQVPQQPKESDEDMTSRKEFILNNVTRAMDAGRYEGLPKLAEDLAEVYTVAAETVGEIDYTVSVDSSDTSEADAPSVVDSPSTVTQPDAPVEEQQSIPDHTPRDQWGLEWSEEWNTANKSQLKAGHYRRKPGTNEEDWAHFLADRVQQAKDAGHWCGPDDWQDQAGVKRYLAVDEPPRVQGPFYWVDEESRTKSVADTLDQRQLLDAEGVKWVTEQEYTAFDTTPASPEPVAPTGQPEPVQQPEHVAPTASPEPVGASAASEIPTVNDIMQKQMALARQFGATGPETQCIFKGMGMEPNLRYLDTDDKRVLFFKVQGELLAATDAIKAERDGLDPQTLSDTAANILLQNGLTAA